MPVSDLTLTIPPLRRQKKPPVRRGACNNQFLHLHLPHAANYGINQATFNTKVGAGFGVSIHIEHSGSIIYRPIIIKPKGSRHLLPVGKPPIGRKRRLPHSPFFAYQR